MKVAFIHNEKKIGTGAHFINDLMALKLREFGVEVKNFYPRTSLVDTPAHLGGLKSILFFYSLLERRKEILRFNVIQGTTYTVLPFLAYSVPVVSHFGSTSRGFLKATPIAIRLEAATRKIWYALKKRGAIRELNVKTRRPLRDIADIEEYVASRATAVIAASEHVRQELIAAGVPTENIRRIHNAIEDYWFNSSVQPTESEPGIVFLGRLGSDAFTLKLKGLDRLIHLYQRFPNARKSTFCITANKPLVSWLRSEIPNHSVFVNIQKDKLPAFLRPLRGGILFIPSRYEGFSLSLVEGMSQGLIPVVYPVGVAPEIIRNGENGFIVSSQAEAIEKTEGLLADTALRERLSAEAAKTAEQSSSAIIAKELIKLYESVIRSANEKLPFKNKRHWNGVERQN
ncbi:MAG: glycosyltransferase family 4 protein [Candidatus Niyogibacteria bacterium]|nr:glycosyltransferase family 4 protein [Candidatus Niyogibacteria bacterium]